MNKVDLRQTFLAQQKALSLNERDQSSAQVADFLFDNFDFAAWQTINCFVTLAKNNELDSAPIFGRIWRDFPQITMTAPRIIFETTVLEIVKISPETTLKTNKWGIIEPQGDETIDPLELDAVFVPLIAFDEQGFRVGYGKGFYDKFLSKCRNDCAKIGLSLFPPVKKIADVNGWDIKLDFCVTPEKIWTFK